MATTTGSGPRNLRAADTFISRHLGPRPDDVTRMLETVGAPSIDALIDETVPASIRMEGALPHAGGMAERDLIAHLEKLAARNVVNRSFIGMGYYDTVTPPVILRNVLENPGWYTQYTPYQSEISQGRLEALLNFQTMVIDLTALDVAGASLLDEATAAAEAMTMARRHVERKRKDATRFFVSGACHPQTIAVIRMRAEPLGLEVVVGDHETFTFDERCFGAIVQYPDTSGEIHDLRELCSRAHDVGASVIMATDLLALTLLAPPGEIGADIAVGSAQRFGVPLGFGGPHAAFMAVRDEYRRIVPGRIVGVSKDASGRQALRLALQTREQHIRRDKATSNICTAQALLAIMASMYAVYHGPDGLTRIARRVRALTMGLADALADLGHEVLTRTFFDTIRVRPGTSAKDVVEAALARGLNLRRFDDDTLGISLDQTTTLDDIAQLYAAFGGDEAACDVEARAESVDVEPESPHGRESDFLTHPVFHQYHSETELLRYMKRLENRDLSLTHSMIPLGSCTMKLNGTSEMLGVTLPGFARVHPFAPLDQAKGYLELFERLEATLAEITGFHSVSLQPNSGAQGEYTGLLVIRAYHLDRGDDARDVCLIPSSAHGTNPASAIMAGMRVVVVRCDDEGNIDLEDLRKKAEAERDRLAAIMITYPSTHGVFEESIREICQVVHDNGGLVYLDGANMNAMVGLARPGDIGADVCHLNLHKTFCIPHGGGGPGMGPICVVERLAPFLPGHPIVEAVGGEKAIGPVAAAPWGSPSILTISYGYIRLMGGAGLTKASQIAILNANYIARRLEPYYPVLYRGKNGRVAHECIIDVRPLKQTAGVEVDDIAKRLIDYGFHAPTMSWPVIGTLMVEPTESESLAELDRFCDAMIAIREEARVIEKGELDVESSPLRHAPHTAVDVAGDDWSRAYSRETAAFPAPWTREQKFWPPVSRVDNVHGDRNLVCACPPIEDYE